MSEPAPEISALQGEELPHLAALLQKQRPEYVGYFRPFAFDLVTLALQLSRAVRDRFWSLREGGQLAGFFMLRGFDAGYQRPAFGVFVAEEFAGRGLARAALEFSLDWCRAEGVRSVMLTVHPANTRARQIYEAAGFHPTGSVSPSGDAILACELRPPS